VRLRHHSHPVLLRTHSSPGSQLLVIDIDTGAAERDLQRMVIQRPIPRAGYPPLARSTFDRSIRGPGAVHSVQFNSIQFNSIQIQPATNWSGLGWLRIPCIRWGIVKRQSLLCREKRSRSVRESEEI
jgi:hypothetical protein